MINGPRTRCPLCGGVMDYYSNRNFWICQKCKAEVWPYTEDTTITETADQLWKMQQSYVNSLRKKGSSSSDSTGKAKEKKEERIRGLPD